MINRKSGLFTALLGATTALSALSIDISLPALPAMTTALSVNSAAAQWTLSLFMMGFAGGQLFLGPLSDRLGRRPVLLGGLTIYVITGVACAMAPSIGILVFMRLLQGLSACAGQVVIRAIIRDLFDRPSAAAKQSIMTVVTTMAMLIAPIVGAWVLAIAGWRSVFALLPVVGGIVLVLTVFIIPETRPESYEPRAGTIKSYLHVLREPTAVGNALVVAFIFAGLFVFISDSSTVFIRTLGVTPQVFSWMFAIVAFGQLCGSTLNRTLAMRVAPARLIKVGGSIAFIATSIIAVIAIWPVGIYPLLLAIALYAFALGMTNPNAVAAAMVPLPQYAGAASAVIGCTQFLMGSIAVAIAGYILPGTISGMLGIMSVFGFAGVAVLAWLELHHAKHVRKVTFRDELSEL
jgi:DHA1 family bicyclomycin/chloramphenicol resistance-like MFS transporter